MNAQLGAMGPGAGQAPLSLPALGSGLGAAPAGASLGADDAGLAAAAFAKGGKVPPQHLDSGGMASGLMSLAPLALMALNGGGKVPTILSPGEGKLTPKQAMQVASGKKDAIKAAKVVPGKAKVKGDSLANDVVPTKMEAGSLVLPRSVMQSPNAHWAAKKFVEAHLGLTPRKKKS